MLTSHPVSIYLTFCCLNNLPVNVFNHVPRSCRLRGGSASGSSTPGSSLELPSPFAGSASQPGTTCCSQASSCASPLCCLLFLFIGSGIWVLVHSFCQSSVCFYLPFSLHKKGIFQILNKTNSPGLFASCSHPSYFVSLYLSCTQCQMHLLPHAWLFYFIDLYEEPPNQIMFTYEN